MRSPISVNRIRRIVTVAVLAAVVAPAVVDRASFPLSTYPIYAHSRDRSLTINVVTVTRDDGSMGPAGLDAIARTDDPLIAQSAIDRAVRSGRAAELCATIAARVDPTARTVRISIDRYDLVDHLADDDAPPRQSDPVESCPVP